jgi:hypothetical protein
MEAQALPALKPFAGSMERLLELTHKLQGRAALSMQMSSLESLIAADGRELLRTLLEEHVHLRGPGDVGPALVGQDEVERTHRRVRAMKLKTIFGEIEVERQIYSKPDVDSLAPKEAMLNLPAQSYSHELQQRLARELAKGSYGEAIESVKIQTGVDIPRRQAEAIVRTAAKDFQAFYEERRLEALRRVAKQNEFMILTTDGKGIVMLKKDLREATKKRAEETNHKLKTRLSKGEKKNAKRMAQVASVYSIEPNERTPDEVAAGQKPESPPRPQAKRVWASVEVDAKDVVSQMFDEASRRDPYKKRRWVALVDGQPYQLGLLETEIKKRDLNATIIIDIIHVIEYLWTAARDFHPEASSESEAWVSHYLLMILQGKATQAAAGMRRSATRKGLEKREGVEDCAGYLHNNAPYMNYSEYLAIGSPIGTGVIEGACRHLVKDRMDLTGARWSLTGAEAVLRLRSVYASGDWQEYWAFHEAAEYERNHRSYYAHPERLEKVRLRIVK